MSGFGGFGGGFGQNNTNNQQSTGFGGFGQTNTSTGFGSPANNTTGFGGSTNTGGGLFGSGGTSGFGNSGGFGTQNSTGFGAKPGGFGAATTSAGNSLFGGTTATANSGTGFGGGFGTSNTASPFGGASTGGGLFGSQSKPATTFGATGSTPSFGTGGGGFGATPANNTFGAPSTALGGAAEQCQGTGAVPFAPTVEKEPASSTNAQNSFQSISFQQPYQKFSPEELRLADYAQGRRYGNAGGTAGAFGTSTGFGGFGASNNTASNAFGNSGNTASGGLFGSGGASSTPFGQSQPTNTGFGAGAATSGGLFGQKPATPSGGGLFGNAQSTTPATGGLFGSNTASTGGFGSNTTSGFGSNNTATGGSLFGANNQSKPGFSFGAQPAAATTGFGGTTGTTGAFGSTGGSSLFGNNAQPNTSSLFGGATAQPAANNPFGGFGSNQNQQTGTTSLFGGNNQAAKPATGLFGSTGTPAAGGGLFGNNNASATANNPFGGSTTNNASGGLFGAKPATNTGSSLFGGTANNATTNTGGGLFGGGFGNNQNQTQPQQNGGTSLFGGLNNNNSNNQAKPSLFGQTQPAGGSLFGGNNNQSSGGGLFGGLNNSQNQQPQQQQSLFSGSSLFGGSQNQQSQPQSLTASINDPTAFGSASMFSNMGTPEVHNPGPIATPLSSLSKQKKSGVLPLYKMNPASASSRFATPQKRGFGFSYSSYGTPGSASSTSSTPLLSFGNSLGGSTLGRGLSKSMSTSSLRNTYNNSSNREDSLLAPGAFSASPSTRFNSTGSMKKLTINRGIRHDLFSPPPKELSPATNSNGILKKRVSFDASTIGGSNNGTNGATSPLKQVQSSSNPSPEELGYLRSSRNGGSNANGSKSPSSEPQPEMEQVKGNELAIVPEEEAPAPVAQTSRSKAATQEDQEPGDYWMSPTKEEILNMNRSQRQKVGGFTVGRNGVGSVTFDTPVDLTNINIDDICGKIVILSVRQATVYPDQSKKPPVGKGLNVPSTISLENSWPRGKDKRNPTHDKAGPRFQKHVERLKKVPDTHFLDYNKDTGVWSFAVEHFTTYGLDYDDETDGEGVDEFGMSTLSAPPDTPTPQSRTPKGYHPEVSFASTSGMSGATESDPDDTFDFKKKNPKMLPGAFDDEAIYEDEDMQYEDEQDAQSFLDDRSAGSQSDDGIEEPMDQDDHHHGQELVIVEDQEMAGSFPQYDDTAEQQSDYSQEETKGMLETPGGIMRARMRAMRTSGSPLKRPINLQGDDWTEMLKHTISPQKQDREELKRLRDSMNDGAHLGQSEVAAPRPRVVSDGRGFATSIDLMHSLFGEAKSPAKSTKVPTKGKGFQWPYAKVSKSNGIDGSQMVDTERAFHSSMKPSWGPNGTLVYAAPSSRPMSKGSRISGDKDGLLVHHKGQIVCQAGDVCFATFSNESSSDAITKQKSITTITDDVGVPHATLPESFKFTDLFNDRNARDPASHHERLVWELASILFDDVAVPEDLQEVENAPDLLRKDNLSAYWQKLVDPASTRHTALAKSNEEKAIACLSGHRISDACAHLLNGEDFHLATLVSLIGGNESRRRNIREQLNAWQKSSALSEFSQPIRAIYEILSGNVCVCDGTKGAPEDRITTFILSERFGLDWRQAFGLRLWYSITTGSDLGEAVHLFAEDLHQDKETARPEAWYIEQGIPPLWEDEDIEYREDLLWGLLKLYALSDADLEAIIRPENSQLSPLDVRLSWQLSRALTSSGVCSYGGDDADDKADQLTLAFASQLTNEGNWLDATFVLLHLSSTSIRAKTIQDHLAHHAGRIGSEDSQAFNILTHDLRIPASWIWEAKALYMRSVQKDATREVECLLRAGAYEEAHRTFSKEVAPRAIIERDWESLRSLLSGFSGQEAKISEWRLGGELYADYLHLLDGQKRGLVNLEDMVLERLLAALPAMLADERRVSFLETVAIQEISAVVAKIVVDMGKTGKNRDRARVLRLPLTEDRYLRHTIDLSVEYYRSVMAGDR